MVEVYNVIFRISG